MRLRMSGVTHRSSIVGRSAGQSGRPALHRQHDGHEAHADEEFEPGHALFAGGRLDGVSDGHRRSVAAGSDTGGGNGQRAFVVPRRTVGAGRYDPRT